jgi:putative transposase
MIRTFKRKLTPTQQQAQRLGSWIGACRCVYNLGLEIKIAAYKNQGKNISAFELMKQLPELKKEYSWIKDVPSQSLQAVLERLDRSYRAFFKGAGFPKWASKKTYTSAQVKAIGVSANTVFLPKMGRVRIFKDAPIPGTPKTAQIVMEPTGLFICIQCAVPDYKLSSENQAAGIDMGIAHFCTLSDGTLVENPKHFAKYERQLRIEQRSLARKKKGSKGWKRQARQLAKLHHRMAPVRKDFLHKTATPIAKSYSTVYVEELNIRGMSRNRHLSKHILDGGWGLFRTLLEDKTQVVKVNPQHTSQTCHQCGAVDARSRVSRSQFVGTNFGVRSNADHNAAKNIMCRGAALVRKRRGTSVEPGTPHPFRGGSTSEHQTYTHGAE